MFFLKTTLIIRPIFNIVNSNQGQVKQVILMRKKIEIPTILEKLRFKKNNKKQFMLYFDSIVSQQGEMIFIGCSQIAILFR